MHGMVGERMPVIEGEVNTYLLANFNSIAIKYIYRPIETKSNDILRWNNVEQHHSPRFST